MKDKKKDEDLLSYKNAKNEEQEANKELDVKLENESQFRTRYTKRYSAQRQARKNNDDLDEHFKSKNEKLQPQS